MYFPKSQIKENQYTNGGEFELASTNENYVGAYFSTSKGDFFTGKNTNDKPNNKLVRTSTKISVTESPLSEPIPENYYVIDESYYNARQINTRGSAPRKPKQSINTPTDKDYQNGFFILHFAKKTNENQFIEISKEEYKLLKSNANEIQHQLYIPIKVKWALTGNREDVYKSNQTTISNLENKNQAFGFSNYFRKKFDKFWLG